MVTHHNWTPIFEWYVASFVVKNEHQKAYVSRCGWIMCSYLSRFNCSHNWEGLIVCSRSQKRMRLFTSTSCNFWISISILISEKTNCVPHNSKIEETIPCSILQSALSMELEVMSCINMHIKYKPITPYMTLIKWTKSKSIIIICWVLS